METNIEKNGAIIDESLNEDDAIIYPYDRDMPLDKLLEALSSFDVTLLESDNVSVRKQASFSLEFLISRAAELISSEETSPTSVAQQIALKLPINNPSFVMLFGNTANMREHMKAITNACKHLHSLHDEQQEVLARSEKAFKDYNAHKEMLDAKKKGFLSRFFIKEDTEKEEELFDFYNYYQGRVQRSLELIEKTASDIKQLKETLKHLEETDRNIRKDLSAFFSKFDM
jgi:hypothetical protein